MASFRHLNRWTHCLRWVVVALVASLGACTANPLPDPPNVDPEIVPEQIETPFDPAAARNTEFDLVGLPGSVRPFVEGTLVWILNLDRAGAEPVVRPVDPDGSFNARLSGALGDVVRIELLPLTDAGPIDLVSNESNASLVRPRRPLGDCLSTMPDRVFDFGDVPVAAPLSAQIRIVNECGSVFFESPRLHFGDRGFSVLEATSAGVTVEFAPDAASEHLDVLFIETSGPSRDRIPITLRGRGF